MAAGSGQLQQTTQQVQSDNMNLQHPTSAGNTLNSLLPFSQPRGSELRQKPHTAREAARRQLKKTERKLPLCLC